jgi:hypothetical protein
VCAGAQKVRDLAGAGDLPACTQECEDACDIELVCTVAACQESQSHCGILKDERKGTVDWLPLTSILPQIQDLIDSMDESEQATGAKALEQAYAALQGADLKSLLSVSAHDLKLSAMTMIEEDDDHLLMKKSKGECLKVVRYLVERELVSETKSIPAKSFEFTDLGGGRRMRKLQENATATNASEVSAPVSTPAPAPVPAATPAPAPVNTNPGPITAYSWQKILALALMKSTENANAKAAIELIMKSITWARISLALSGCAPPARKLQMSNDTVPVKCNVKVTIHDVQDGHLQFGQLVNVKANLTALGFSATKDDNDVGKVRLFNEGSEFTIAGSDGTLLNYERKLEVKTDMDSEKDDTDFVLIPGRSKIRVLPTVKDVLSDTSGLPLWRGLLEAEVKSLKWKTATNESTVLVRFESVEKIILDNHPLVHAYSLQGDIVCTDSVEKSDCEVAIDKVLLMVRWQNTLYGEDDMVITIDGEGKDTQFPKINVTLSVTDGEVVLRTMMSEAIKSLGMGDKISRQAYAPSMSFEFDIAWPDRAPKEAVIDDVLLILRRNIWEEVRLQKKTEGTEESQSKPYGAAALIDELMLDFELHTDNSWSIGARLGGSTVSLVNLLTPGLVIPVDATLLFGAPGVESIAVGTVSGAEMPPQAVINTISSRVAMSLCLDPADNTFTPGKLTASVPISNGDLAGRRLDEVGNSSEFLSRRLQEAIETRERRLKAYPETYPRGLAEDPGFVTVTLEDVNWTLHNSKKTSVPLFGNVVGSIESITIKIPTSAFYDTPPAVSSMGYAGDAILDDPRVQYIVMQPSFSFSEIGTGWWPFSTKDGGHTDGMGRRLTETDPDEDDDEDDEAFTSTGYGVELDAELGRELQAYSKPAKPATIIGSTAHLDISGPDLFKDQGASCPDLDFYGDGLPWLWSSKILRRRVGKVLFAQMKPRNLEADAELNFEGLSWASVIVSVPKMADPAIGETKKMISVSFSMSSGKARNIQQVFSNSSRRLQEMAAEGDSNDTNGTVPTFPDKPPATGTNDTQEIETMPGPAGICGDKMMCPCITPAENRRRLKEEEACPCACIDMSNMTMGSDESDPMGCNAPLETPDPDLVDFPGNVGILAECTTKEIVALEGLANLTLTNMDHADVKKQKLECSAIAQEVRRLSVLGEIQHHRVEAGRRLQAARRLQSATVGASSGAASVTVDEESVSATIPFVLKPPLTAGMCMDFEDGGCKVVDSLKACTDAAKLLGMKLGKATKVAARDAKKSPPGCFIHKFGSGKNKKTILYYNAKAGTGKAGTSGASSIYKPICLCTATATESSYTLPDPPEDSLEAEPAAEFRCTTKGDAMPRLGDGELLMTDVFTAPVRCNLDECTDAEVNALSDAEFKSVCKPYGPISLDVGQVSGDPTTWLGTDWASVLPKKATTTCVLFTSSGAALSNMGMTGSYMAIIHKVDEGQYEIVTSSLTAAAVPFADFGMLKSATKGRIMVSQASDTIRFIGIAKVFSWIFTDNKDLSPMFAGVIEGLSVTGMDLLAGSSYVKGEWSFDDQNALSFENAYVNVGWEVQPTKGLFPEIIDVKASMFVTIGTTNIPGSEMGALLSTYGGLTEWGVVKMPTGCAALKIPDLKAKGWTKIVLTEWPDMGTDEERRLATKKTTKKKKPKKASLNSTGLKKGFKLTKDFISKLPLVLTGSVLFKVDKKVLNTEDDFKLELRMRYTFLDKFLELGGSTPTPAKWNIPDLGATAKVEMRASWSGTAGSFSAKDLMLQVKGSGHGKAPFQIGEAPPPEYFVMADFWGTPEGFNYAVSAGVEDMQVDDALKDASVLFSYSRAGGLLVEGSAQVELALKGVTEKPTMVVNLMYTTDGGLQVVGTGTVPITPASWGLPAADITFDFDSTRIPKIIATATVTGNIKIQALLPGAPSSITVTAFASSESEFYVKGKTQVFLPEALGSKPVDIVVQIDKDKGLMAVGQVTNLDYKMIDLASNLNSIGLPDITINTAAVMASAPWSSKGSSGSPKAGIWVEGTFSGAAGDVTVGGMVAFSRAGVCIVLQADPSGINSFLGAIGLSTDSTQALTTALCNDPSVLQDLQLPDVGQMDVTEVDNVASAKDVQNAASKAKKAKAKDTGKKLKDFVKKMIAPRIPGFSIALAVVIPKKSAVDTLLNFARIPMRKFELSIAYDFQAKAGSFSIAIPGVTWTNQGNIEEMIISLYFSAVFGKGSRAPLPSVGCSLSLKMRIDGPKLLQFKGDLAASPAGVSGSVELYSPSVIRIISKRIGLVSTKSKPLKLALSFTAPNIVSLYLQGNLILSSDKDVPEAVFNFAGYHGGDSYWDDCKKRDRCVGVDFILSLSGTVGAIIIDRAQVRTQGRVNALTLLQSLWGSSVVSTSVQGAIDKWLPSILLFSFDYNPLNLAVSCAGALESQNVAMMFAFGVLANSGDYSIAFKMGISTGCLGVGQERNCNGFLLKSGGRKAIDRWSEIRDNVKAYGWSGEGEWKDSMLPTKLQTSSKMSTMADFELSSSGIKVEFRSVVQLSLSFVSLSFLPTAEVDLKYEGGLLKCKISVYPGSDKDAAMIKFGIEFGIFLGSQNHGGASALMKAIAPTKWDHLKIDVDTKSEGGGLMGVVKQQAKTHLGPFIYWFLNDILNMFGNFRFDWFKFFLSWTQVTIDISFVFAGYPVKVYLNLELDFFKKMFERKFDEPAKDGAKKGASKAQNKCDYDDRAHRNGEYLAHDTNPQLLGFVWASKFHSYDASCGRRRYSCWKKYKKHRQPLADPIGFVGDVASTAVKKTGKLLETGVNLVTNIVPKVKLPAIPAIPWPPAPKGWGRIRRLRWRKLRERLNATQLNQTRGRNERRLGEWDVKTWYKYRLTFGKCALTSERSWPGTSNSGSDPKGWRDYKITKTFECGPNWQTICHTGVHLDDGKCGCAPERRRRTRRRTRRRRTRRRDRRRRYIRRRRRYIRRRRRYIRRRRWWDRRRRARRRYSRRRRYWRRRRRRWRWR